MCHRYAGKTITGKIKTTPIKAILAGADLPTVVIRVTQHRIIAMEMSLRMPDEKSWKADSHSRSPPAHVEDKLEKES